MFLKIKNKLAGIIIRGGRYAKVDLLYLVGGNFWLGIGTAVSAGTAFVLALAFGNFVTPETYGTYRFVLSFYSILALAGLSGFGPATVRAVAKGFEGNFFRSFKIQALGSLAGTAVSFAIATYYFINHNNLLGFSFIILGVALPFIESLVLYDALLSGRREFKKLTKYGAIAQILAMAILLGGIFLHFGVIGLLLIFFFGWTAIRFLFFIYIVKKFKPNKKTKEGTVKLGAHLTLMGVLTNVATYLDRIAIFHFLGAAQVAIYSFAIAPSEQLKGLFKNTSTLAIPRFSQRSEAELKNTMLRKMAIMAVVITAVIISYIILAPLLFKLLLPKYTSSIFPSQIFIISLLGVIVNLPLSAMKSLSKIRGLYFYNTASSIINIVLILILTPVYGLMGTIMARLITRFVGIFLSIIALYLL